MMASPDALAAALADRYRIERFVQWRPRGGELYYRNGQSMMVVSILTAPTLQVGAPRELFRGPFLEDMYGDRSYDVMPDGEQFVMIEANPTAAPELRVIRDWSMELESTVGRK